MNRWQALKKVIKPKNLIMIILLVVSNSFAWFIYATQVNNEMSAHVRAWRVLFEAGDSQIVDYANVDIESMYPGMEDFLYEIKAINKSEVSAQLKYTLLEAKILNTEYITIEGRAERGETVLGTDFSSAQLLNMLENNYPFSLKITLTSEEIDAEVGQATYKIEVTWPFESGNDELDTVWGKAAASYKENNPTKSSITLKIKITISQIE